MINNGGASIKSHIYLYFYYSIRGGVVGTFKGDLRDVLFSVEVFIYSLN